MSETETAEDEPTVPLRKAVSREDVTIKDDGTHTGPAVKRIDTDRDKVIVYCPCGHYRAQFPVSLRESYYKGSITCVGALPGYPR